MPLTNAIMNMFGRSPIRPLQKHMDAVADCAKILAPFFEAVLKAEWDQAEILQKKISDLEMKADTLKKDLRLHLPSGLFMAVDRSDILELLTLQDAIANRAQDIAGLVLGRKILFPETIAEKISALTQKSIKATKQAQKAINELDELLEAGFRGKEVTIIEEMIIKLDELEHATDEEQAKIRHEIFAIEKTLPPIDVMFLYKVVEWIGDLADRAHRVGGRLLLLLAR